MVSIMANFKDRCKIEDRATALAEEEHAITQMSIEQAGNIRNHANLKKELIEETKSANHVIQVNMERRSKLLAVMTDNNQQCDF